MPHVPPVYAAQPLKFAVVFWLSQYGKIVKLWLVHGRQVFAKVESVVVNCALPLDDRFTLVKV